MTRKDVESMTANVPVGPAPASSIPSSHFSISGEVARPGTYSFQGPLTLAEAVQMAGGFTDFANTSRLTITHATDNNPSGTPRPAASASLFSGLVAQAAQNENVNFKKQPNAAVLPDDAILVPKRMF